MRLTVLLLIVSYGFVLYGEEPTKKVPSFYAKGLNTDNFFLSKNIGKQENILLNFFTTSCIPCRKEIPFLEKKISQYNIDKGYFVNIGDPDSTVQQYLDKYKYDINVLLDPYGVVAKRLKISVTPTLMIISGDGRLVYRHTGFQLADTVGINAKIKKYFREK